LNNEVIRAENPSAVQGGVAVSIPLMEGSQRGDDWVFVVSSDDDMDSEDEEANLYAAFYEPKG
jgi:predicted patatin/cPLA2 family phospholipase